MKAHNRFVRITASAIIFSAAALLSGCRLDGSLGGVIGANRTQQWEYKVMYFDRESHDNFDRELKAAGEEGWQYAGPLCNDGVNAQFVAFRRPK